MTVESIAAVNVSVTVTVLSDWVTVSWAVKRVCVGGPAPLGSHCAAITRMTMRRGG